MENKQERNSGEKLFFAVYQDKDKQLQHIIVYRKNKKILEEELKKQGFTPKGIFSQMDMKNIQKHEFFTAKISDKVVDYFLEHIEEWNMAL